MRHKKYLFTLIIMLGLLTMFATSMTFVLSQAPGENLPTVIGPTEIPATATAMAEQAAADTREIKSRDWTQFRVAYLVDTSLQLDEIVSAATIQEKTGALVFDNAEDFTKSAAEQPFQIVLIHGSMKDKVDREWINRAYREATAIIVGIDLYRKDLLEIIGNYCTKPKGDLLDYVPHTWAVYTFMTLGGAEHYKEGIYKALLETCSAPLIDPNQSTYFSEISYMGTLRMDTEWELIDWQELSKTVMTLTYQFGIEKQYDLLPQSTPEV